MRHFEKMAFEVQKGNLCTFGKDLTIVLNKLNGKNILYHPHFLNNRLPKSDLRFIRPDRVRYIQMK